MDQIEISISTTAAAVLLRCLSYGRSATSQVEEETGVAKVIREEVDKISASITKQMAEGTIKEAAAA